MRSATFHATATAKTSTPTSKFENPLNQWKRLYSVFEYSSREDKERREEDWRTRRCRVHAHVGILQRWDGLLSQQIRDGLWAEMRWQWIAFHHAVGPLDREMRLAMEPHALRYDLGRWSIVDHSQLEPSMPCGSLSEAKRHLYAALSSRRLQREWLLPAEHRQLQW